MNNMIASWEDEENNRQIHFSVTYVVENGKVEINDVTPDKVAFVCPESNTVLRQIGVHTSGGRSHLASKLTAAGQIDQLATEIAKREGLLVNA